VAKGPVYNKKEKSAGKGSIMMSSGEEGKCLQPYSHKQRGCFQNLKPVTPKSQGRKHTTALGLILSNDPKQ